jgi:MFS family permease
VIQGIGSAMIFGTGMAMITAIFDAGDRGKALGINVAVVYLALALGPSAGGFMMYHWGWKSIFLVIAAVAFIACIGSKIIIKQQWIQAKGEPFDLKGSILYGIALFMLIYGFTILPSLTGFIYFINYEKKKTAPVLNVKLFFTNRLFTYSSFAALINYAVTFPISFFLSLYLQEVKGVEVQYAGLILIVQPVIQAALSPFAGRLSDKIHSHYLASAGMVFISLALLLIAIFISPSTPIGFIVCVLVLLGIGFAAFSSPNTNTIMSSVEKKDYSMASATTGTMRLTGQAFSMGITTMILSLFLGKQMMSIAVIDQFMGAMRVAFILFAVLSSLGIYASMKRNS